MQYINSFYNKVIQFVMKKQLQQLLLLLAFLMVSWVMQAQVNLTVHDGTSTNAYVPVYGFYTDAYLNCQMLYPASELVEMTGGQISGLTFYASQSSVSWGSASFQVYVKEVTSATISSFESLSSATMVHQGSLNITGGQMSITFSTPYTYLGGNLLVAVQSIATGSYVSSTWYGESVSGSSLQGYSSSGVSSITPTQHNFLPKTTFSYTPGQQTCPMVDSLQYANLTNVSVDLSWIPGDSENAWELTVSPAVEGDSVFPLNSPFYTFSNLTPSTHYSVRVCAVCSGSDTSYPRRLSFYTPAALPAAIPYACDFEQEGSNGWDLVNDGQANAWYAGTAVNHGGSRSLYISSNNGNGNIYDNINSSWSFATRALNIAESGEYSYSFDWRCMGESAYDYLRAALLPATATLTAGSSCGFGSGSTAPAGAVMLDGGTQLDQSSGWNNQNGTFYISTPGLYQFVFAWGNDGGGGSNPPAAVDNVVVVRNTCPQVRNLAATYVSGDSVTLTWSAGGSENEWIVISATDTVTTQDTAYTLTQLNPNTVYTFGVIANCGGDSSFAKRITVRTACGPFAVLPYSEDFNSYDAGDSPSCWSVANAAVVSEYGASLKFNGSSAMAVTPRIPLPVNQVTMSFDLRAESLTSSGTMRIGYTTDPTAADSIHYVQTITPTVASNYVHYEFDLSLDSALFDVFDTACIVFHQNNTSNYWYWLDNLVIEQTNPCTKPDNVAVNAGQADSVVATWVELGNATSWQVYVGTSNVPPSEESGFIVDVNDNAYAITGLVAGNAYYFFVRSNCGDGFSNWTTPVMFVPGSVNMPITGMQTVQGCGMVIYDDGGPTGNYAMNANGTMVIYPSSPDSVIRLWGTYNTMSGSDKLTVYDGVGISDRVLVDAVSGVGAIDTVVSTTGPLTIRFVAAGYYSYQGFELHAVCGAAPDCGSVENLAITPGITSAMVTWTPGYFGEYSGADVEFRPAGSDTVEWTVVSTSDTYKAISGLTPNTEYEVRVAAVCGGSSASYTYGSFTTIDFPCIEVDPTLSDTVMFSNSTSSISGCLAYSSWGNTAYQTIYTAAELVAAGLAPGAINAIDLGFTPCSNYTKEFTIWIANSNATSITNSTLASPVDHQLVYGPAQHPTGTSGWQHYEFDQPFMWDGSSSIMITTTMNQYGGSHSSSSGLAGYYVSAPNKAAYRYQDSSPFTASNINSGNAGSSYNYRASIHFYTIVCAQQGTCAAPVASIAEVTTNSIKLIWAPGNTDTSWNVYYRRAGDANYTLAANTTNTTYTFQGLASGTPYQFQVVSLCSATDSMVASLAASTECAAISSLPFSENFNSWGSGTGVIPNCWSREGSYSSYGSITSNYNCTGSTGGSYSTYASNGATYTTYLTLPALDTNIYNVNSLQLVFSALNPYPTSYNVDYSIGVMTDPYNVSSYVPIDTVHVSANGWETFEVPLGNYSGNGAYISVKAVYVTGYGYGYIDDLTLESIPTCPRPDSLRASNPTNSSVDLRWHERGTATDWIVEYGPLGFQLGTGTIVQANSNPFTLTGLPSSYDGEYYVRSVCSTTDTGLYSRTACRFSTMQVPAVLPYTCDFEGAEATHWQTNSNCNVNWFVGTADAVSPTHAMYVSADDGATVSTNGFTSIVNASAYRDIDFGPVDSSYIMTFKAKAGGTLSIGYDGLVVLLADPSVPVVAPTDPITSPWGNLNDLYIISMVRCDTSWQEYSCIFDTIHGTKRVAFFWFNQGTASQATPINFPAAVDDISINYADCPRPVAIDTTFVSNTSVGLTWHGPASAHYEVVYRTTSSTRLSTATTNTNSITLTGLTSGTKYICSVYKICGNDTSFYSDAFRFTTLCDRYSASQRFTDGFEGYSTAAYNTAGDQPTCWLVYSNGTNPIYLPHVVNSGSSYYYRHTGSGSLTMTSGSATYGDTKIVALPLLNEPIGTLKISFWSRMESTYSGELTLGYVTDDSIATSFVPIATVPSTATMTKFTSTLEDVPATATRIALKWSYGSSYYTCAIDDVVVELNGGTGDCPTPVVSLGAVTYQSANITWTGTGTNYEVAIKPNDVPTWPSETSVRGRTFTFTALQPGTTYSARVRQVCTGEEDHSLWSVVTFTTDSLLCNPPTNVATTNLQGTRVTLAWTPGGDETAWDVHLFNTAYDSIYTLVSNPATLEGLSANVTYMAAVRSLCGDALNIEGDWGDTIQFTTPTCPNVNGLTAGNVTYNSVGLSWTNVGSVESYVIEYGYRGFSQGAGYTITGVTTNNYTVTGLEAGTQFDFYVKAVCAAGWLSENWSSCVHATTSDASCTQYAVDANINGNYGHVAINGVATNRYVVDEGQPVTLVAVPDEYCRFIDWTMEGNVVSTDSILTFTPTGNVSLTATFQSIPRCTINAVSSNPAMGSVVGGGTYFVGETCTLSASSSPSYYFKHWNDGNADNPRSFVVTGNANYTAVFTDDGTPEETFQLKLRVKDPTMGVVTGGGHYVAGSDATIHAIANPGYVFEKWSDRNNQANRTITVDGDIILTATFQSTQGIDAIDDQVSCIIYPNPTSSRAAISVNGVNGQVRIQLFDMSGRLIASETMECSGDCVKTMNVNSLAMGTYFVRISGDRVSMVKKLVVR